MNAGTYISGTAGRVIGTREVPKINLDKLLQTSSNKHCFIRMQLLKGIEWIFMYPASR